MRPLQKCCEVYLLYKKDTASSILQDVWTKGALMSSYKEIELDFNAEKCAIVYRSYFSLDAFLEKSKQMKYDRAIFYFVHDS